MLLQCQELTASFDIIRIGHLQRACFLKMDEAGTCERGGMQMMRVEEYGR